MTYEEYRKTCCKRTAINREGFFKGQDKAIRTKDCPFSWKTDMYAALEWTDGYFDAVLLMAGKQALDKPIRVSARVTI